MLTHWVLGIVFLHSNKIWMARWNIVSLRKVPSQMTEVPDNRTSQMAELKHTEKIYNMTVIPQHLKIHCWNKELGRYILYIQEFLSIVIHQVSTFEYTVYIFLIHYFNIKFWRLKKYRYIANSLRLFKIQPSDTFGYLALRSSETAPFRKHIITNQLFDRAIELYSFTARFI